MWRGHEGGSVRPPNPFRFEHHHHALAPRSHFWLRVAVFAGVAALLIAVSLGVGMAGYEHYEGLEWHEAFLNASMLLGGMGPVDTPRTNAGKLFAGTYALYAGLVFLVSLGVGLAPIVHRAIHRFHIEDESSGPH
jgi:hypothetical protein